MGGEIEPISDRQQITDLKLERNQLENLILDIVNARGQKSRKDAIDRAREILYPEVEKENYNWFTRKSKSIWGSLM